MAVWKCYECNTETEWSDEDVADKGTPVCPNCDEDMELSEEDQILIDEGWVKIGSFGVDSGQVLITDPCYLHDWKADEFKKEEIEEMQKSGKFAYSYNGACARTLMEEKGKRGAGHIGLGCDGVVSPTGWGDGEYEVYALYKGGRVKELKIRFF